MNDNASLALGGSRSSLGGLPQRLVQDGVVEEAAMLEAVDLLKASGITADYMRIKAFPFGPQVKDFVESHERCIVVEQNRDAQFRALLTLETAVEKSKLRSLLHYNGLPTSSTFIVDGVLAVVRPRDLARPKDAAAG